MRRKKESLSPVAADEKGKAYQNIFNIHNEFRKSKEEFLASPIAEIYKNPSLTEGSNSIYTVLEQENFPAYSKKRGFYLNYFENISVDKIAILFNSPANKGDAPYLKTFWRRFNSMIDFGRPKIYGKNDYYKYHITWFECFDIQWEPIGDHMPTIRLEFNPNKATFDFLAAFFACFKKHAFESARVSRLDVAVDYSMYLNPLCWRCKEARKQTVFLDDEKITTRYFGSSQSDVQIRIYDKALELKQKSKLELGFDFWRTEVQVSKVKGETFNLVDVDTISGFNPFERLQFYDLFNFEPGRGNYAFFFFFSRAHGVNFSASLVPDYRTREIYL